MAAVVNPERLLRELHGLWIDLGREAEADGGPGVIRACALTLIVMTEDAAGVAETLAEVMREHPCRGIVVSVRPDASSVDARVSAQCWLPLGQKRQICSEQIEITASGPTLGHVYPLLNALTAPDLPVVVWYRGASLFRSSELRLPLSMAGRLILDSGQIEAPGAFLRELIEVPHNGLRAGDLAWTRLTCWRDKIAQLFEAHVCRDGSTGMSKVHVLWEGRTARSDVVYMAAWIAEALGWEPQDSRLCVERARGAGDGRLLGVRLAAPGMTVAITREDGGKVAVTLNGMLHEAFFPERSEASALTEELSIVERDAVYERVLPVAARLVRPGLE